MDQSLLDKLEDLKLELLRLGSIDRQLDSGLKENDQALKIAELNTVEISTKIKRTETSILIETSELEDLNKLLLEAQQELEEKQKIFVNLRKNVRINDKKMRDKNDQWQNLLDRISEVDFTIEEHLCGTNR